MVSERLHEYNELMQTLRKYLWIFIFGGIGLGLFVPEPILPFKDYLMYPLMVLVFLSALKIDIKIFKKTQRDLWRYFFIVVLVFFIPALLAFILGNALLPHTIFLGLLLITAAPTAIAVVFLSDILGGDPGKALIGSTFTNLISPLLTPLCIWVLVHTIIPIPFFQMLALIAKLLLVPFILAQIVRAFHDEEKIMKSAGWLNEILLFFLIWGTIAPARENIFQKPSFFFLSLLILCVVLIVQIAAGYFFGREKKEKITWIIIGISKNFTLTSVLALTLFGTEALIAPTAFIILSDGILVPLEWWFRQRKI